ncbi:ATP-binding protein [Pedococcus sp. KACC 23699]|uniref:histidine kinase n=1 Tax=Pedococcus sp. KACC 23699 TaxID=3149228 RepID=A0AAU7JTI4_9MICO
MRLARPRPSETAEVRRAVARYLIYGAVALVLVSAPTFYALGRIAEQHALDSAALDGASIARRLLAPGVTDGLLAGDPEAISDMDRRLVPRMSDGSLARVKIWSIDGVVLYSDEHRLIGRNFASDLEFDKLRPGGPAVSSISDLAEGENLFETAPNGLVEVYTLLPSAAGQDVVYELYLPLVLVERERSELVAQMAPVGMLALGTLALSQLPLAVGLARRVSSIRRSRTRLLAQTVRAVELERRRLAQDLHDDVIQDLSGVAVALESVGRDGGRLDGTVDRGAEILRRDVQRLRDIVADLFPVTAYEGGLDAAIRDLTTGLGRRGVAVGLELDPDHGLDPVSAGLIYRVAREAVVNVAKHAHATTLSVHLSITSDAVHLEVSDDGRGPDPVPPQRVAGHVGLDIVRETIEEAGGSVVVEANSPNGTTVRAYLPR